MTNAPSKYHSYGYIGEGQEGANENGYIYTWDSYHPELEPTETFSGDIVKHNPHCSYCGEPAFPVRKALNSTNFCPDSITIGYTCICEAAEAEKEYRKEFIALQEKHRNELQELQNKFRDTLLQDEKKQLEVTMKYQEKDMKWKLKHARTFTSFHSIESKIQK